MTRRRQRSRHFSILSAIRYRHASEFVSFRGRIRPGTHNRKPEGKHPHISRWKRSRCYRIHPCPELSESIQASWTGLSLSIPSSPIHCPTVDDDWNHGARVTFTNGTVQFGDQDHAVNVNIGSTDWWWDQNYRYPGMLKVAPAATLDANFNTLRVGVGRGRGLLDLRGAVIADKTLTAQTLELGRGWTA